MFVQVDIADLSSVHKFCEGFKKAHTQLNLLINNAGTATLVFNEDKIMASSGKEYGQIGTYAVSKLCNLVFMKELDRRLKAAVIENITTAASHPGYCDTKILKKGGDANKES
ncbi:hypothetical protein PRIC1_001841 [Phytophthora ramorum]